MRPGQHALATHAGTSHVALKSPLASAVMPVGAPVSGFGEVLLTTKPTRLMAVSGEKPLPLTVNLPPAVASSHRA